MHLQADEAEDLDADSRYDDGLFFNPRTKEKGISDEREFYAGENDVDRDSVDGDAVLDV